MKKEFLKKIIIVGMTSLIITNMYYIPASAKWINNSKNNWNWIEGEVKATGWKKIDKDWYYFNEDGVMSTGWIKYNENWYNLSSSGSLNTGWKQIDKKWYYFKEDGAMSIGWINDNGNWYFTNSSGEMETGTLGIDGQVYTFSDSGTMLNNKVIIQQIQTEPEVVGNIKSDKNDSKVQIGYVSTNSDSLNIRLEASISSAKIGTLAKGAEVKIIDDEKNGFYHISTNGTNGWVSSSWISFEKPIIEGSNASLNSDSNEDKNEEIDSENNSKNDSGSNSENDSGNDSENNSKNDLDKGEIRDTEPSLDNEHYYSDSNVFYKVRLSPPFSSGGKLIKGNCTWYAWGRAWEITGSKPNDAGFIGNGYEWWEANKKSGKYEYGSKPRVGSIAVWKSELPNSGGSGHVAIVEKIEDGKIYISESMWHGVTFKYREIYETSYLYGYIYLDKPNY